MNQQQRCSSISGKETKYFDQIPVDLVISNIFSRLPLKSIAKCRCVSKLWSYLIRRPNYNQLFPIKSPSPPRILFAIEYEGELFFYSSPQPHNPDENPSLVATLHHRNCLKEYYKISGPVCGLVCRQYSSVGVIINPITGESLNLPKQMSLKRNKPKYLYDRARYDIGYDPIGKQFKVLCMSWFRYGAMYLFDEYQVLTLGTGNKNLLWRKIDPCCQIHLFFDDAICIDGVLYYPAYIYKGKHTIFCFDVTSEKFSFANIDQDMAVLVKSHILTLMDYKGKLGACIYTYYNNLFQLWVLEDAQRHKWSKRVYQMHSPLLYNLSSLLVAGIIGSGEIVLYPYQTQGPFFILYYNLESNILKRVKLEVPILFSGCSKVRAFTNYVEDLKLM